MDGRDDVSGLADVKVAELWKAVDRLATKMTELIETEGERRDNSLDYLGDIFAARQGTKIPQTFPSAICSVRSVGHNIADNGTSSIIVEFKKSQGSLQFPKKRSRVSCASEYKISEGNISTMESALLGSDNCW